MRSSSPSTPATTFSGGIKARLSKMSPQPRYSEGTEWKISHLLFHNDDVTLALYASDNISEVSRLEIVPYIPHQVASTITTTSSFPKYSFPLQSVVTLTHANTKRGIAMEVLDHSMKSAPMAGQSEMNLLQLSFTDGASRERVYVALQRAWEAEKRKQRMVEAESVRRSYSSATAAVTPSISEVLQGVKKLQAKTHDVLAELRKQEGVLFSADGEFMLDPNQSDSDQLRAWALHQLEQRQGLDAAENELRLIQERRARRRAMLSTGPTQSQQKVCPHCRNPMQDPSHIDRCAYRPVNCAQCGRTFTAKEMQTHRNNCTGGMNESGVSSPRFSNSSGGSFLSLSPPKTPEKGSVSAQVGPGSPNPILKKQSSYEIANLASSSSGAEGRQSNSSGSLKPWYSMSKKGMGDANPMAQQLTSPQKTEALKKANWYNVKSKEATEGKEPTGKCPHCHRVVPKSHVAKCAYREVRCKTCGEQFAARDFIRHQEVCKTRQKTT